MLWLDNWCQSTVTNNHLVSKAIIMHTAGMVQPKIVHVLGPAIGPHFQVTLALCTVLISPI